MSLQLADVIVIRAQGTYLDQEFENVYTYAVAQVEVPGSEPTLVEFVQAWIDLVLATVRAIQVSQAVYRRITGEVLNTTDFTEVGVTLPGTNASAGDLMPPFVAAGYDLVRSDKNTRSGFKRFCGITEGNMLSGGVYSQPTTPNPGINDALSCGIEITEPGDFGFTPVPFPQDDPFNYGWVAYPAIIGRAADGSFQPGRFSFVSEATTRPFVTTQNSRKRGRGD